MVFRPESRLALLAAVALLTGGLVGHNRISGNQWLLLLAVALVLLVAGTRVQLPAVMPTFNRSLIRTAMSLAVVFILISAHLIRIQVVDSSAIVHRSATAPDGETLSNPRLADSSLTANRGSILDRNGHVIAETVFNGGEIVRSYPNPATGYVAGYYSPLLFGASGLEQAYDDELSGRKGNDPFQRILDGLLNRPAVGANLQLTLDQGLQEYATSQLGGQTGSVVVMDVRTGEVIVLVSAPTYDPNQLYTSNAAENEQATAYWRTLLDDPRSPLVLRANQGLYTPGSTFKTVTAAIAIQLGLVTPDDVFDDNGEITIDGRVLVENNRPDDTKDRWTVREGLAWSLNVVFAQIGLKIGADELWKQAGAIGIGADVPFDLPVAESQIASNRNYLDSQNAVADTAFGQGQLQVSPLQMCMVASMFANGGTMMRPYLVDRVMDQHNRATFQAQAEAWRSPISKSTADQVQAMMVNAVDNGSVWRAQADGYVVGGKTGTAETGNGTNHSWFIGFIGENESRYAVAATLEAGNGGLATAVEIGRNVLVQTMTSMPPR